MAIDFLVIGHITHDACPTAGLQQAQSSHAERMPDNFRLGGTVTFAAVTALRLGVRPGIVTRGSPEGVHNGEKALDDGVILPARGSLAGVPIRLLPSPVSTTFVNVYHGGHRTQVIEAMAAPIAPDALPSTWATPPIVLLGPIVHEIEESWLGIFPNALLGVTPQGWMRTWDDAGHVRPTRWGHATSVLQRVDTVVLSREDVGGDEAYIAELARQTRLLVVTDGWHGVMLYSQGGRRHVKPRPAVEVDPTGAGDVFTAAFLVRLAETHDPLVAARFANVVASMSIEAPGVEGIPYRARVDAWLRDNG